MKKKAAFLSILPAASGFLLLFAANFLLVFVSVAAVSAGALGAPVGILYLLGFFTPATDLSPPALASCGLFCASAGLSVFFLFLRTASFSMSLFRRYAGFLRGERPLFPVVCTRPKKLFRIFSVLALVFLAFTAAFQFFAARSGYKGSVVRETLEFEKVKYIDVATTNMDFDIKPWSGEKIKLEYVNDSRMLVLQADENYLTLAQDDSFTLSLFTADVFSYKMTLFLPENDYRELSLTSSSGGISLLETQSEYTEISTRSGAVSVDEATGKLSISTLDGDVRVDYAAFSNAGTINNRSGKTEVIMPDYSGVTLIFTTVSGRLTSDMFAASYENAPGSVTASHPAPLCRNLAVKTDEGDLILRKE